MYIHVYIICAASKTLHKTKLALLRFAAQCVLAATACACGAMNILIIPKLFMGSHYFILCGPRTCDGPPQNSRETLSEWRARVCDRAHMFTRVRLRCAHVAPIHFQLTRPALIVWFCVRDFCHVRALIIIWQPLPGVLC